jgi:hypothetical protein
MPADAPRGQLSQGFVVGVDASRSAAPQPTGTELYSRYLIEALLDRAPEHFCFRLYFNQPPQSATPHYPQRSASSVKIEIGILSRLWTHLRSRQR